jgi:uncharacterized membrane protein
MFFQKDFLKKEEGERIIESIRKAENRTSGEIRVHFQRKLKEEIMEEAVNTFHSLKMNETAARNGVLLFIVPTKKQFCILGDSGINAVVPDNFWEDIKDDLSNEFKAGRMADGICRCVEAVGEKLQTHFPIQSDDENELPDTISYG